MKSQKDKDASKAQDKSQEYKQIESLMISLTYLAAILALSIMLAVGGLVFFAMSAIVQDLQWVGLIVSAVGFSGILGIYVWALASRSR